MRCGALVAELKAQGVESVAICLLHAYANAAHEQALRHLLAPHFRHLSVSSEINAEFREYERACTTVLNASVMPLATAYLDDLRARLPAGRALHLLHSGGGMMSVEAAVARPLTMAMSGPAAGVAAAAHTARTLGIDRALAFDMGGTTTDVCLIADGVPETAAQKKLGDYPVRLPMLAVESIGAGGGSIARVEAATGALKVGPDSAGALPGPAAYGLGGRAPTVTDANVILGYLNPGSNLRRFYPDKPRPGRGGARASCAALRPLAHRRRARRGGGRQCEHAARAAARLRAARLRPSRLRPHRLWRRGAAARRRARAAGGDEPGGGSRALRRVLRARLSRLAASLRRGPDVSRARRRLGSEGGRGPLPRARAAVPGPAREGGPSARSDARHAEPRPALRGTELRDHHGLRRRRRTGAARGIRAAAPAALWLCHRREHRVREPARGRDRVGRLGGGGRRRMLRLRRGRPRCRRDRIARSFPRRAR